MPPSRVGPTGHRRARLDNMRRRAPAKDSREPSPDTGLAAARSEHFEYYNLGYNSPHRSRKPVSATRQKVVFKDPFEEDRQRKNQVSLPVRSKLTTSLAMGFHKSLPFRQSDTRRSSSADEPYRFDTEIQMALADLRRHSTDNSGELSPTQPDRIGGRVGQQAQVQLLTSGVVELNLKESGKDDSTAKSRSENPRRGAAAFRGVPSVQQLSAALASDVDLQPGLDVIAESLFDKDILPEVYIPANNSSEDEKKACIDRLHKVVGKAYQLGEPDEATNEELEELMCL